jgi:hypothetical protein
MDPSFAIWAFTELELVSCLAGKYPKQKKTPAALIGLPA